MLVSTRAAETIDSYARSDDPLMDQEARGYEPTDSTLGLTDDAQFWEPVLDGAVVWNRGIHFQMALSEWIARVPGLYWTKSAQAFRSAIPATHEIVGDRWRAYEPFAKSTKVLGGVGTIRLPPAPDGFRMCTLTASLNASSGIPALISPDLWQSEHLCEGAVVDGSATWLPMPIWWGEQFPSLRGIPRGCLIMRALSRSSWQGVRPRAKGFGHGRRGSATSDGLAPILVHPFTIMEYQTKSALLYDYVYASMTSIDREERREVEQFMDGYRIANGRYGRYLLSADIMDPLWDAEFSSPASLRSAGVSLVEARVQEVLVQNTTIEPLLEALASTVNLRELREVAELAGIPGGWMGGGSVSEEVNRLVLRALQLKRIASLIEAFAERFPGAWR